MTSPSPSTSPRWLYPLLAAAVAALLVPLIHLLFLGSVSLRQIQIWLTASLLAICIGLLTWLVRRTLCEEALGLAEDRYAALPALARISNSSLVLTDAFGPFIERLRQYVAVDRATIISLDEAIGEFHVHTLYSRFRSDIDRGYFYPLEGSRIAWLVSHGRAELTPDITNSNYWDWQAIAEEGMRGAIEVPLHDPSPKAAPGGRIIGVFRAFSTQPDAFCPDDLQFLATLSQHIATALANSLRFETNTSRMQWLEMMHELEDGLGQTLDLEEVLRIVANHAHRSMQADRILVILPEDGILGNIPSDERWQIVGPGIKQGAGWHKLADFGRLVSIVAEKRVSQLIRLAEAADVANTPLEPLYYSDGLRSLALMPVLNSGHLLGILLVGWRSEGAISQENLAVLQDLAAHLGVALRNVAMAAQLKGGEVVK